jgi:DNA polymerase III delta prime subunit
MFAPAVKTESKLRMAIAGPSGSGKTYTALAVAAELVPGGRVAVIDTEHGSAAKYADLFKFDVAHAAPPYHPDGLIKLVTYAANNGYDVIIVDSTTHYWSGAGGVLDLKDDAERRMRNPNSYTAWKDVTPIHQRMVDALISVPAHVIVTMRSKQEYVLVEKNGKQVPQKMGMAPIQRDGFEYEFDVMMDMDVKNVGHVTKTRCPALTDRDFVKPGADMAAILREWLTGAAPSQAPAPVVFAPAPPAVNGKAQPAADSGPLPDDELTIEEAPAAQFIPKAADLLKTDAETLKARLKALGYGSIPGKPAERVAAYRKLRADMGAADDLMGVAGQPPLVTVDDDAAGHRELSGLGRTANSCPMCGELAVSTRTMGHLV